MMSSKSEMVAKSLDDLGVIAKSFFKKNSKPQVVLLHGSMGAGKTTFVKALCHALGSENKVSSPTFSLVNEYLDWKGKPIYHFDLYRIEEPQEVLDFGIEEYLNSGFWCFIEWPELALQYLPDDALRIGIEVGDYGRVFSF